LFLSKIANGIAPYRAGRIFEGFWNNKRYVYRFCNKVRGYFEKSKTLLPDAGDRSLSGLEWIYSVVGKTDRPIFHINKYCLEQCINAVFCTHTRFLRVKKNKPGTCQSHTSANISNGSNRVDSS